LKVILAFEDPELTESEKQWVMLRSLYPVIPEDVKEAIDLAGRFLNGGKTNEETEEAPLRLYSFVKDADYIFAAFKQTHGVDLTTEQLHWWKFLALFMDLGSETTFCSLVNLREKVGNGTATKEEKQAAEKLGDIFSIEQPDTRTPEEKRKEAEFMKQIMGRTQ
jgi:hypothetical protein